MDALPTPPRAIAAPSDWIVRWTPLLPPVRPVPLNVPPPPDKVIVSVSVTPGLVSPIVTLENGLTGASEVVVCPATVPLMAMV